MLRLVIAAALLAASAALAEEPQAGGIITYREPTAAELERQQAYMQDNLQKGEGYFSSKAFEDSLKSERAKVYQVPDNAPGYRVDMPAGVMSQSWADRFNEVEAKATNMASNPLQGNRTLIVFASLSMPRETLQALAADARKVGGAVVFRGLKDDDFVAMRKELQGLGEGFAIDPTLYQRFAVEAVPTFVLPVEPLLPCDMDGCPPARVMKLTGNVSVEGALDYMHLNSAEPGGRDLADAYLKKLRNE